jgi:hypothetical protein
VPPLSAKIDFRYPEDIVVSLLAQSGNVPKANALTGARNSVVSKNSIILKALRFPACRCCWSLDFRGPKEIRPPSR